MTTRYWEERECVHGSVGQHRMASASMEAFLAGMDPDDEAFVCPGGQRRELTGVETILLDSSGRQPKQWCLKHDCEGLGNNDDLVGCTGAGVGVLADMDCRLVTVVIIPLEEPE